MACNRLFKRFITPRLAIQLVVFRGGNYSLKNQRPRTIRLRREAREVGVESAPSRFDENSPYFRIADLPVFRVTHEAFPLAYADQKSLLIIAFAELFIAIHRSEPFQETFPIR